jgi:predicted DNA binding CopG/RHH family protein
MKSELPKFSSNEELADWIDNHDISEYMDDLEEVTEDLKVRRTKDAEETIGVILNSKDLEAIKQVANDKGVPYQTLIQTWVIEKLHQEAPDSHQ